MEALTLAELKAQNAAEEAEAEVPQTDAETTNDAGLENEAEPEKVAEPETGKADETKPEAWQLVDDDEQGSQDEVTVPVGAHARMRSKLKGRIGEQNDEIKQLKAEIAELRSGVQKPADATVQRPKLEDFATDQEYEQALDAWYDKKVDRKLETFRQTDEQALRQQREAERVSTAVTQHYAEAEQLAKDNDIAADTYRAADMAFRSVFERQYPDAGDAIADSLIARLGELGKGSAKVTYYVGRNKAAQAALAESLRQDPTGMHAAMYLGQKMAEIAPPRRKVSQAPEPAANATGDVSVVSADEKRYRDAYRKADKAGDVQKRWEARVAAKKAGFDVSQW